MIHTHILDQQTLVYGCRVYDAVFAPRRAPSRIGAFGPDAGSRVTGVVTGGSARGSAGEFTGLDSEKEQLQETAPRVLVSSPRLFQTLPAEVQITLQYLRPARVQLP